MSPAARSTAVRRLPRAGVAGGVCAGIAARTGVDAVLVRLAFVAATAAGGLGLAVYALAWVGLAADEDPDGAVAAAPRRFQRGRAAVEVALGVGLLLVAALLTVRASGLPFSDAVAWPLILVLSGAALLWRTAGGAPAPPLPERPRRSAALLVGTAGAVPAATSPPERPRPPVALPPAHEQEPAAEPRAATASRTSVGVALVLAAAVAFLQATGALGAARDVALAALAVAVALGVIFAPWVARMARTLSVERAARIRSQERAEVAAHLHDSVLQTLALVQKRADDPRAVATLARTQERELRAWLSGDDGDQTHLAAALRSAAADVERAHGVAVEVVAVGDAELDERSTALVAAAREAMVNAAKFAGGAGAVDVFAEAAGGEVHVFVRDRGPGFDPGAVGPDRRGVRDSIVGRMERHGGRAEVRSAPGAGTEVELTLEARP